MKKIFLPIICGVISVACFAMFVIKNSYVDSDGILHEPFALIPIGYTFLFLGLALLTVFVVKKVKARNITK